MLNAHATMLAKGKTLSDDLKVAFETFLAKVEENWQNHPIRSQPPLLAVHIITFGRNSTSRGHKDILQGMVKSTVRRSRETVHTSVRMRQPASKAWDTMSWQYSVRLSMQL